MINKKSKKIIIFSLLVILIISLMILVRIISPEEIVDRIGVRNGYILAFVVSFFGGFSAAGSISFITLLITLVAGGINPFYLALVSGISLAIGDMIMFYLGSKGRELIRGRLDKKIDSLANIFKQKKTLQKLIPILTYLYIGFAPLPNDLLILFLAAIEYPMKKMNIIIIMGDLTFALVVTFLAAKGIMFFI